jgi:hypothetical protein
MGHVPMLAERHVVVPLRRLVLRFVYLKKEKKKGNGSSQNKSLQETY